MSNTANTEKPKDWWKNSVVYQIYPRSFNDSNGDGVGDINGITEKLPYIKELGADVIWLSPVYPSPLYDNGYDISDYRGIHPDLGTMEDFDRMLKTAHDLGLKIMMDLVVNHTSDEHEWFQSAKASKDSPYRDYYIWKEGKDGKEPNNWGSMFEGSVWDLDDEGKEYYLHLFSKKQPDLNWENPKVRQEVYDLMDYWLAKGVDGFRMDVISLISKDQNWSDEPAGPNGYGNAFHHYATGPREHEFLKEMRKAVLDKYDTITVGECPGATPEQGLDYANLDGSELNMVFTFEHVDVDGNGEDKWANDPVDLVKLKKILDKWQVLLHGKAWNSLYWDNHDQPRIVSRWGNDSEEYREKSAKMLATVLHTMQGTPYIYQGEELGMTNYPWKDLSDFRDIESLNAFKANVESGHRTPEEMFDYISYKGRDNARTPMQWDDTKNGGFSEGTPWIAVNPNYTKINAEESLEDPESIFHYYQDLIAMRKANPIILEGDYTPIEPERGDLYAFVREYNGQKLLTAANFTDQVIDFQLPEEFLDAKVLISNEYPTLEKEMKLAPYQAFTLLLDKE